MITLLKATVAIAWLAIIYNWIQPLGGTIDTVLHWTGIALIVSHIAEMFLYQPTAKKAGGNIIMHSIQFFIFGIVHKMALEQNPPPEEAAE